MRHSYYLFRAGNVRAQTPKVPKKERRKKKVTGRAKKRKQFNKANNTPDFSRKNPNQRSNVNEWTGIGPRKRFPEKIVIQKITNTFVADRHDEIIENCTLLIPHINRLLAGPLHNDYKDLWGGYPHRPRGKYDVVRRQYIQNKQRDRMQYEMNLTPDGHIVDDVSDHGIPMARRERWRHYLATNYQHKLQHQRDLEQGKKVAAENWRYKRGPKRLPHMPDGVGMNRLSLVGPEAQRIPYRVHSIPERTGRWYDSQPFPVWIRIADGVDQFLFYRFEPQWY